MIGTSNMHSFFRESVVGVNRCKVFVNPSLSKILKAFVSKYFRLRAVISLSRGRYIISSTRVATRVNSRPFFKGREFFVLS